MATVIRGTEQRVLLRNIPWEVYDGLLAAQQDASVPRCTYDRGLLEIMSPSAEHEHAKAVRGKAKLDLTIDPPPDLVVEIDITASSLDKPSIFARFGIHEVWRYDVNGLRDCR